MFDITFKNSRTFDGGFKSSLKIIKYFLTVESKLLFTNERKATNSSGIYA